MSRLETFGRVLEISGHSHTQTRLELFNQLLKHSPISAAGLARLCEPSVDRATTYRNLHLFERLGIVKRIWIGFKSKYELSGEFVPHHHHLECSNCKRVMVIEDRRLEELLLQISDANGLEPQDHQVEIIGLCQNCRT